MRYDPDLEALRRSPVFQGILPDDLQRLARGMAQRRYRRNGVRDLERLRLRGGW